MQKLKGLSVDIMGTDCTNKGVTSGHKQALLVMPGKNIGPIDVEGSDLPVLTLIPGKGRRFYNAVPANENGGMKFPNGWHMFGGHFIYSSDSRFTKFSDQPIHVHDRFEW